MTVERFRKVCPQCNTVVHAMECNRSMRLRKVCAQCNTVVHVKRSVCDCGHAFASKKRKTRCSQHTSTITSTAAPRVWHFSAFSLVRY